MENGKLGFFNAAIDAALVLQPLFWQPKARLGCLARSARFRNQAEEVAAVLCLPDKVFRCGAVSRHPAAAGHSDGAWPGSPSGTPRPL